MLPASRSGKTRTLARPATGLPGALRSPTPGTRAASACISPSTAKRTFRRWSSSRAARTLATRGWSALPLVEKERRATRGSSARRVRQLSAAASAMSASCSGVGSGTTAQSL